jgi:TonB family protein
VFEFSKRRRFGRNVALASSFLAHGLVVFLWLHREPAFIKPSGVAWGHQGTTTALVDSPTKLELAKDGTNPKRLLKRKRNRAKPEPVPESARVGMPDGSLFNGPASGVEAKPALPVVFPDPAIYPWQLKGLQGDVIVEITIDQQGNVAGTRVLQSLKADIDAKCVATLREWHFRPAMVDGVAIRSRQDVHFHFPS